MTVAEQIRTARISKNLSLRALAAKLDVTHTTIHAWETGRVAVPFARLLGVCQALDLDHEDVIRPLWYDEQAGRDHEQLERAEARLAARRARRAA